MTIACEGNLNPSREPWRNWQGDWGRARPAATCGSANASLATELETLPEQVRHLDEEDATVATKARLE